MQNAAGGVAQAPHDRNDAYGAVVSDLVSLAEHVQNCLRLIERAIGEETSLEISPCIPESSTNVIVLDDVSPRYMKAAAALQACDVNLGIALRSLRDPGDGDSCALKLAGTFGHRGVSPTRHRPAGAHDVPPPQNFHPDFLAPLTTCCDRGLASIMPRARRTRTPPPRWRSSTRRSTI